MINAAQFAACGAYRTQYYSPIRWSGISAWPSIFPRTGAICVSLPRVAVSAHLLRFRLRRRLDDLLIRNVGKHWKRPFYAERRRQRGYAAVGGNGYPSIRRAINPYWLSQAHGRRAGERLNALFR